MLSASLNKTFHSSVPNLSRATADKLYIFFFLQIWHSRKVVVWSVGACLPGLFTMDCSRWTVYDGLFTMDCLRWTVDCLLWTVYDGLYDGLFTMDCLRWTVYDGLYNGLFMTDCLQGTVYDGLFTMCTHTTFTACSGGCRQCVICRSPGTCCSWACALVCGACARHSCPSRRGDVRESANCLHCDLRQTQPADKKRKNVEIIYRSSISTCSAKITPTIGPTYI